MVLSIWERQPLQLQKSTMQESHREILRSRRMEIASDLNASSVAQVLYSQGVFDKDDLEEIQCERTANKKAFCLLDMLPMRGPRAFEGFLQALYYCNYSFLAKLIQGTARCISLESKVPKFVGRIPLCQEITALLIGGERHKLVTLVSPPGFGKTAVATTVGHIVVDHGTDVLYFSLRNTSSLTAVAKAMLETIGLPVGDKPIKQIIGYLASLNRDTVLILDNAEDLQSEDGVRFEEFLEHIGHAQFVFTLLTSRESVSKLELFPFLTKHIPLEPLNAIHSAEFLRNHVPGISDQWANIFAEDCGGVPLLLVITSGFLKRETVDPLDLHTKLQNCPHEFLDVNDPLIIQHLCSPLKVFFNQLPAQMRNGLEALAAFPTSFTAKEAMILFPTYDVLDFQLLLGQLVKHSLLQKDQGNGYYSLHPLVQSFCKLSRHEASSRFNMSIKLFCQHYLTMLRQLSEDFVSTDCKSAIAKYNSSKANIQHALISSTEDTSLKCFGLHVSTEAVNFLAKVLSMDEFRCLYSCLQQTAKDMTNKTCYSECLVSIGFKELCYDGFRCATGAKKKLNEAYELQNRLKISDTECYGHCMSKLGLCLVASGDAKRGISLIARAIAVRKKLLRTPESGKNERMLLTGGFCDLGMALFTLENYKAAVNIWTNFCLKKYSELLGTHPFTASLLGNIGNAYQKLGNFQRAVKFRKKCLTMRRDLLGEDHQDTANAYYGLGCTLGAVGDNEQALEILYQALRIQERVHSSKHDIERTRKEINSIRGRSTQDPPSTMLQPLLQSMHLEN